MNEDCDFSLNISSGNDEFVWPQASTTSEVSGFQFTKQTPKAVTTSQPAVKRALIESKRDNGGKNRDSESTKAQHVAGSARPTGRARLLAGKSHGHSDTVDITDNLTKITDIDDSINSTASAMLTSKVNSVRKEKSQRRSKPDNSKNAVIAEGGGASPLDVVKNSVNNMDPDANVISFEDVISSKPKFKSLTAAEDPHQYHAKPRDLDGKDSMLRPSATVSSSNYIFSNSSFDSLCLDSRVSELLMKPRSDGGFGLRTATRCQQMSLPVLLQRQNVLIRSETGSGKTLAYLLPIVNDLINLTPKVTRTDGTRAVVIAPTRELCVQISGVFEELSKSCVWIVGGCISGGEKKKSEKARLRKGVSVLVSTPGRLLDHLKTTESFDLKGLRWLVFDEADRLLDMGFEQTILEILSIVRGEDLDVLKEKSKSGSGRALKAVSGSNAAVSKSEAPVGLNRNMSRHLSLMAKKCSEVSALSHVMASATLTGAVKRLAGPIMGDKEFVIIDADSKDSNNAAKSSSDNITSSGVIDFMDDESEAPHVEDILPSVMSGFDNMEHVEAPRQLNQYCMHVTCKWRLAALLSFLKQHSHQKVMVFFSTCDSVDYHSLLLKDAEWPEQLDEPLAADEINHSSDSIDPPAFQFTGVFGNKCKLYRLHGSVPQKTRQDAFKAFCDAKSGIMLCTDVAARGLDLPHVDWILQYDPPCETTDYVHRIGRTARKGLGGSALIFLLPSEAGYINLLSSHGLNPTPLSLQGLFMDTVSHVSGAIKFKNSDEMCAVILQRRMERTVLKNKHLTGAGRQAYRSFIRAYATHSSDSKGIFQVQLLHLGHLAKSFALAENITTLRNHEDTISKIMNGMFTFLAISSTATLTAAQKKEVRNQKYSLSGGKKSLPDGRSGNKNHDASKFSNKRQREYDDDDDASKRSKSENMLPSDRGEGVGKHSIKNRLAKAKNSSQKVRKMGSKGATGGEGKISGGSSALAPSGRFRKTTGYFKKQLRSQSTFEFSG